MRINVLGVGFDNLTMDEAVNKAYDLMKQRSGAYIVTPNPEIVMRCREDEETNRAVNGAPLVISDGIGIIYGAKILGTPLKQKIPGIELTENLIKRLGDEGGSVFLFGARPGVADKAAANLKEKYPGLVIAGTNDGYFTDDSNIVNKINEAKPDFLLVCLGMAKQEKWMASRSGFVDAGIMIGAGGSLDVFAGEVQRAPEIWCRLGLEWLYRLIKEPWRFKRMLVLPKFLLAVIGRKLSGKAS